MAHWIPVGGDFIEADVIRWRESIFSPRPKRGAKPERLGQRFVTAEVREKGPDWIVVEVRQCKVIALQDAGLAAGFFQLREGTAMKRKLSTIAKGGPERLIWSDEQARCHVRRTDGQALRLVSRFSSCAGGS